MKRKTVLKGYGSAGDLVVTVESDSKDAGLMREEHETKHLHLVDRIHDAMGESGCYKHKIKVK